MSDQTEIPQVFQMILDELREIKQYLSVIAPPVKRETTQAPVQKTATKRERNPTA